MADAYKKISDFTKASEFGDNDLLLVSQTGTTRALRGVTLKEFAKAAGIEAAKINNAVVNASGHLILTTTDGASFDAGKVDGEDGVSVTGASIDSQYHLILTFSDGSTKDAGYCRGVSGAGTGDMLQETYDPDGEVASKGGIATYVSGETNDVWQAALLKEYYDPYNTVYEHGGVEGYVQTLGRDVSTPIGTIRTTVRDDYDTTCWMPCDGSEVSIGDAEAVWQMLYLRKRIGLDSFSTRECVDVLDYMTVTDPTSAIFTESDANYRLFMAVSGMSGSDAVLRIYGTQLGEPEYSLLKTFTVSGQTAMEYPCAIAGKYYNELAVAWTLQDKMKIYYTTDLETWSESEITVDDSMKGHKIDMCSSYKASAWAVCDCTNGAVYATKTPGDSSSWGKMSIPDECQGRENVSARMGQNGTVIRLVKNSYDGYMLFAHRFQIDDDGDTIWRSYGKIEFGTNAASYLFSRPFGNSPVCFAVGRGIYIDLKWTDTSGWFDTVWVDTLPSGCKCTDIRLHGDGPAAIACRYTDAESADNGMVWLTVNTDFDFFRCDVLDGSYPLSLYYNSSIMHFVDNNGCLRVHNYGNDTVTLPNISLSDNTVTLIKYASEEYAD